MAERLKASVLKTEGCVSGSGVRIPLSPPTIQTYICEYQKHISPLYCKNFSWFKFV